MALATTPFDKAREEAVSLLAALAKDRSIHPDARGFLFNAAFNVMEMGGMSRPPVPGYEIAPGMPVPMPEDYQIAVEVLDGEYGLPTVYEVRVNGTLVYRGPDGWIEHLKAVRGFVPLFADNYKAARRAWDARTITMCGITRTAKSLQPSNLW
jgi:hypothetical protein